MRTKDFQGFRFGRIHTSDLHLEVVSTSDRYEARVLPNPTDVATDVPGSDGQYYFGSVYKNREITCNVAFNNVSEKDYRKIRQLFATDKLQDLVFDEEPYKTWRAKLKSKPEFKSLCFTDKEAGERVYKGDGKLQFICYYPYAFGFDKYVVRAADYYTLNPPECIIKEAYSDETFVKNKKNKPEYPNLPEDTKYHYNVNPSDYEGGTHEEQIELGFYRDKTHRNKLNKGWDPNDSIPWKTGFPTYDQVAAGELFFDTPQGEKTIVDVRTYWDNVPEWEGTAKLLTTPTLDFEQELMYLPQYSKTDYINMETGFQSGKAMIGSRLLVYNPGDLPVEWELKFNENKRSFWSCRGGAKFRIRRFNVERLSVEQAVDWCGLETYEIADDDYWKYGYKYFKRRVMPTEELIEALETEKKKGADANYPKIMKSIDDIHSNIVGYYSIDELIEKIKQGILPFDKQWEKWDGIRDITISNYAIYARDKVPNEYTLTGIRDLSRTQSIAFNTHLDEWNLLLQNNGFNTLKELGDAHPRHCYYVEPIPKEKLGHYIKLFYWQTIQWRGDQLPDGTWTANERYREMIKDCLNEDGTIIDEKNPLIQMALMFARIRDNKLQTLASDTYRRIYAKLDFEEGIAFANRYEEMYELCIDDDERYELYWDTLKRLLGLFAPIIEQTLFEEMDYLPDATTKSNISLFTSEEAIENFIYSYINQPAEYISSDMRDLDYDNEIFNGYKMPQWFTQDYMEIDQMALSGVETAKAFLTAVGEGFDKVFTGSLRKYEKKDRDYLEAQGNYTKLIRTLDSTIGLNGYINDLLDDEYFFNTDNRMLYTMQNPYGAEFVYKPNKIVMNDAIVKGKWFKLPPGWSLICIEPVVDESLWGGKRWEDGRPYDWGYGGDENRNPREVQQLYDYVYKLSRDEFFKIHPKDTIWQVDGKETANIVPTENMMYTKNSEEPGDITIDDDEYIKFNVWYERLFKLHNKGTNYFAKGFYHKLKADAEYEFLKIIHSNWTAISKFCNWTAYKGVYVDPDTHNALQLDDFDITGRPLRTINGDISDWWWYACNYLWANFPPLYWGVADMLNDIKIKYTPLFY